MSTYNVLLFQQGGTLYLDEALPDQPSLCTVTITQLDGQALSQIDSSFTDIEDEACDVADLVVVLPAKSAPWKLVTPTSYTGDIGDMTEEGRKFLLNRGGRKQWLRVSEYDVTVVEGVDPEPDVTTLTELRFDQGIDYNLKAGDTLKDVRCSFEVDWSAVTSDFVGRVKAVWSVTVGDVVRKITKIYDVVRQFLFPPATWQDVLELRPDADNELSQVPNKEVLVVKAWQDIVADLDTMGIRHNLIVADGSTVLRDATVIRCLINLVQHQNLPTPTGYIGQTDDYVDWLAAEKARILGKLQIPIDEDQDGNISVPEANKTKRQSWWRKPQRIRS